MRPHGFSLQGLQAWGWGARSRPGEQPCGKLASTPRPRGTQKVAPCSRNKSPTKPPGLSWDGLTHLVALADPGHSGGSVRQVGGGTCTPSLSNARAGPAPLSTHDAAVLLVVHLLHLQAVRLRGTGEASSQRLQLPGSTPTSPAPPMPHHAPRSPRELAQSKIHSMPGLTAPADPIWDQLRHVRERLVQRRRRPGGAKSGRARALYGREGRPEGVGSSELTKFRSQKML